MRTLTVIFKITLHYNAKVSHRVEVGGGCRLLDIDNSFRSPAKFRMRYLIPETNVYITDKVLISD